jgi:hypothetical protein
MAPLRWSADLRADLAQILHECIGEPFDALQIVPRLEGPMFDGPLHALMPRPSVRSSFSALALFRSTPLASAITPAITFSSCVMRGEKHDGGR